VMEEQHDDENIQVEGCSLSYVATKKERLIFNWPVREFNDLQRPISTPYYNFMEEHQNSVKWKAILNPKDVDSQGNTVVAAQVLISQTQANPTQGFKVTISISIRDVNQQEVYKVGSSVYYLARERYPDGGTPSYKAALMPWQELMDHHQTLLPNNTLTLVVKLRYTFTQTFNGEDGHRDDFLNPNPPTSLSSDLAEALKMADFTDMTIVCDKKEFHCHKFILAARSEVFAAMLRHEFLEKQNSRVDVKEIDSETMELLLYYIYTGQVQDFNKVSVVDLFKAADRYRLDDLKHVCEEELIERVEASNAADILSLAHKYNAQPLKSFSLAMISRNVEEVMRTPGWKEIIQSDQTLLMEAFDSLARYNTELKNKLEKS